jgi:hypothetical protein
MHQALLTPLWERSLELGREPDEDEIPNLGEVEQALGSLKKALRITFANKNLAQLEQARSQRVDELKVYLSLQQFQRRKPYKTLEPGLQGISSILGTTHLPRIRQAPSLSGRAAGVLDECCRVASEQGLGCGTQPFATAQQSGATPPSPASRLSGCPA